MSLRKTVNFSLFAGPCQDKLLVVAKPGERETGDNTNTNALGGEDQNRSSRPGPRASPWEAAFPHSNIACSEALGPNSRGSAGPFACSVFSVKNLVRQLASAGRRDQRLSCEREPGDSRELKHGGGRVPRHRRPPGPLPPQRRRVSPLHSSSERAL